jgi:hypothetical protein
MDKVVVGLKVQSNRRRTGGVVLEHPFSHGFIQAKPVSDGPGGVFGQKRSLVTQGNHAIKTLPTCCQSRNRLKIVDHQVVLAQWQGPAILQQSEGTLNAKGLVPINPPILAKNKTSAVKTIENRIRYRYLDISARNKQVEFASLLQGWN